MYHWGCSKPRLLLPLFFSCTLCTIQKDQLNQDFKKYRDLRCYNQLGKNSDLWAFPFLAPFLSKCFCPTCDQKQSPPLLLLGHFLALRQGSLRQAESVGFLIKSCYVQFFFHIWWYGCLSLSFLVFFWIKICCNMSFKKKSFLIPWFHHGHWPRLKVILPWFFFFRRLK